MRTLSMLLCLGAVAVASASAWADGRVGRSRGDAEVVYVPRSDGVVVAVQADSWDGCQSWDRWSGDGRWDQYGRRSTNGRRFDNHRPSWEVQQPWTMSTYCPTGAFELAPPRSDWQWGIRRTVPRIVDPVYEPTRPFGNAYFQNVPYGPLAVRRQVAPRASFRSADCCGPGGQTAPVVRILIDGQWVPYEPARR